MIVQPNQPLIHTNSGLHIKTASKFSITYTVCKKMQKYGDTFSKSSSIYSNIVFSQTIGLIEVKFHVKNAYDKLAKTYTK